MADACPKCHTQTVADAVYCHHCGRSLGSASVVLSIGKALAAVCLMMVAMGLGLLGTCALMFSDESHGDPSPVLIGIGLVVGAALCLVLGIRVMR